MPKSVIELLNERVIRASLEGKQKRVQAVLEKTAKQMGVLATNEIHPLTAKKTGNWDSTIHAEVHPINPGKVELWVGSMGAFSADGYNYGALQEHTRHPIERGWFAAEPNMRDLWQKNITAGLGERSISQSVTPIEGEFEMMAGTD